MYEIEDNIEAPKRGGFETRCKAVKTFAQLEVGQSFAIKHERVSEFAGEVFTAPSHDVRKAKQRVRVYASRHGKKASILEIDGSTRFWRVA
jgi:hypothetical protein